MFYVALGIRTDPEGKNNIDRCIYHGVGYTVLNYVPRNSILKSEINDDVFMLYLRSLQK